MSVLLGIGLFIALSGCVVLLVLWLRERSDAIRFAKRFDESDAERVSLKSEVERLRPWTSIADVAAESQRIRDEADNLLDQAQQESTSILDAAHRDANILIANADEHYESFTKESKAIAKKARKDAEILLTTAGRDAAWLQTEAERRAAEINERAHSAGEKHAQYERAIRAMKNRLDGYGNEYLRPTSDLLESLSADYGHKEAGQNLKVARATSKSLVDNNQATSCEYVEQSRSERAQALILDSFNGKVEAILSRVKHSNYGKLSQQIRDAQAAVNHGGHAFRNAKVTDVYLDARLLELKWAAAVQELKRREQEEQRAIREQIREEQRAQREYEKAKKQAETEQRLLREAMQKARAHLADAAEEQRAGYEAQLEELNRQLAEAEAKNQRAMSMAQQTRQGHVYIISNTGAFGEHVYKIGLTRRLDPMERVKELGDASVPFPFDVHAVLFSDDAPALETKLHKRFVMQQINKVNHRKEFFDISVSDLREAVEELGIEAKWTMAAEAAEYRESQAITELITVDPEAREQWLNRQLTLDPVLLNGESDEDSYDTEES